MTRVLLFVFFFLMSFQFSFAQQENMWAFGTDAGLDFTTGSPVFVTTGLVADEACASVCGDNGRLLFYTEGTYVWDSTGNLMPNGSDLTNVPGSGPGPFTTTYSATQGALIVPMPDSAGKYYLFSLTDFSTAGYLYYSVVDMSLNNGLGDVEAGRKGILVDSNFSERMTAVVGEHCDIWLLVCSRDPAFKAYNISSSGIDTAAVVSAVGIGGSIDIESMGSIAISPDRTKLGATTFLPLSDNIGASLFDFDPATGIVSNPLPLILDTASTSATCYSICFSPDNSKLYINSLSESTLDQFDLSSANPALIPASRIYIGQTGFSPMKLASNGKIYFFNNTPGTLPNQVLTNQALGAIDSPNLAGTACQYVAQVLTFPTQTASYSGWPYGTGLPNVVPVLEQETDFVTHTVTGCSGSEVVLAADSGSGWDYFWNDGAQGAERNTDTPGIFWVQYHTAPCVFHSDTFMVNILDLAPQITVNGFDLSTTQAYDSYQWYLNGTIIPGATGSTYTVTGNGNYTVVVSDNGSGCTDTSDIYTVTNVGITDLDYLAGHINCYPNPTNDILYIRTPVKVNLVLSTIEGRIVKQEQHVTQISLAGLCEGIYWLRILDREGSLIKVEKITKIK